MHEQAKQESAVAVLKAYDFILWLLPKVEKLGQVPGIWIAKGSFAMPVLAVRMTSVR
jgi:hypothetical protein